MRVLISLLLKSIILSEEFFMKINLTARKPFKFSSVVGSHGWAQLVPYRLDDDGTTLIYTHRLDSEKVVDISFQDFRDGVTVKVDSKLTDKRNNKKSYKKWKKESYQKQQQRS